MRTLCALLLALAPQTTSLPYGEARPILEALREELPPELKQVTSEAAWRLRVSRSNAQIRARLRSGDEDSLANLLMMGTSYTRQPRLTQNLEPRVLQTRVEDLARALAAPGSDERLLFMARLVQGKVQGKGNPEIYLKTNLERALQENTAHARELAEILQLRDVSQQFAERSRLYRDRGLSLDASLRPNFAIEESLAAMKAGGLLAAGSVRRVAVAGPGLDFIDKLEGYDFYPPQTIQPFALIDTLLRLGLAKPGELQVTAFDVSARVLEHLAAARQRAHAGESYRVELPRDPRAAWKPAMSQYWQRFGERVGSTVTPTRLPAGLEHLQTRAVSLPPSVVLAVQPLELNVILERPDPSPGFDLIVATNVLVYYDVFEQCLALRNVRAMLRPGGFLLSNNSLLILPSSGMRSAGYRTTVYSDKPDDGDHVVWYQKN